MSNAELALSRIGVVTKARREQKPVEVPEFVHFENFGDLGVAELTPDGGVLLIRDRLDLFMDRDSMEGLTIKKQKDGRYLVNLTQADGL